MAQQITLNGKQESVEEGATLAGLLEARGVNLRHVAVELNRRIVPRQEYPATELKAGDVLEVVTFVGGG